VREPDELDGVAAGVVVRVRDLRPGLDADAVPGAVLDDGVAHLVAAAVHDLDAGRVAGHQLTDVVDVVVGERVGV